jgi:hypothetical protein
LFSVVFMGRDWQSRAAEQKRKQELARKLVDIGFRALAKECHPDIAGGDAEAMSRLIEVRNRLRGDELRKRG